MQAMELGATDYLLKPVGHEELLELIRQAQGRQRRWQQALAAVFLSGVLFFLLSVTGLREYIINQIPRNLKYAIGAGVYIAKLALAGFLLALFETATAKMRVFRVPQFLGAAFMLGLLGTLLLFVSRSF